MNAVGAYDDVGLDLAAVGKARHSAAVASFDRDAASPEADVGCLERGEQHVEQVGTTVTLSALNCWRNAPRRMREMIRPLFQPANSNQWRL
jgi:hypothetical protein